MGKKIVCIDPGHGQPWPGAVYANILESDFVLNIAEKLAAEIQKRDYIVARTRHAKEALFDSKDKLNQDLLMRTRIANIFNADIFISIHFNAFQNHRASGIETWHFYQSSKGKRLAENIQSQLVANFQMRDRGVKETSKFVVLKKTIMPAILIELGFITSPDDRKILTSADYPELAARAIADGIDNYFNG